jgi:multidrug efflux system membrane fusion protein
MDQQTSLNVAPDHQLPASASTSPTKRRHWIWPFIVLILLSLVAGVIHHHRKKKREAAKAAVAAASGPVALTSAAAKTGDIGVYLSAIGTVTPVYTDSVTSQVTGVIKSVHYREGEVVHQGDLLIDIDPQPYAAQLGEAKGVLERDENLLAQAQMDLERYRQAWSRNGISRQQFEDQEKVVLQDQGTVNYDQAAVQYAQVQLNYCHIVAPIGGRVGIRLVDPGNLVTANATTSLVVITQLRPITVIFTLAEDSLSQVLGQLSQGRPLTVEAYNRTQDKLLGVGKLSTVDNQIDTTTGTVKLRASFGNANNQLFPNQFVNTRLLVTTLHDQVLIPSSAIQRNGDTAFVYLLQDGKAVAHTVRTGISDHGQTAVRGLQAGDVIANSSFEKLQNCTPVTISKFALAAITSDANEGVAQ